MPGNRFFFKALIATFVFFIKILTFSRILKSFFLCVNLKNFINTIEKTVFRRDLYLKPIFLRQKLKIIKKNFFFAQA